MARVFSSILSRDDRIEDLYNKLAIEKEKSGKFEDMSLQLKTACLNLRPIIETLNMIREIADPNVKVQEIRQLYQRCMDTLAADIKTKAGGLHRCGLWVKEDQVLRLAVASSGFPKNYAASRVLDINRSVAGRCIRRAQVIHLDDVTTDSDWEVNPESRSQYKSLICVPVSDWLVLTVDGHQPMGESVRILSELYATVLEGLTHEQIIAVAQISEASQDEEVAAGNVQE